MVRIMLLTVFFETGLCLPSGSNLEDDDRARIKAVLINLFKKEKRLELVV
jgi:hypothetical protein